jgi:hypothetical protein
MWSPRLRIAWASPFLLVGGCATITPPPPPADAVTVYVVDYGRHASLLLHDQGDEWVEFGYGEWGWFAEDRESLFRAPLILLLPAQGTLARGPAVEPGPDPGWMGAERVFAIAVERSDAAALRERLDAPFRDRAARIYRNRHGMECVPVPERYCLFHNCNSELARWLRALGCRVRGVVLLANFRLKPVPG